MDATAVAVEVVVLVADISRMRVPMKVKAMRKVHVQLILIPYHIDPLIINTRSCAVERSDSPRRNTIREGERRRDEMTRGKKERKEAFVSFF